MRSSLFWGLLILLCTVIFVVADEIVAHPVQGNRLMLGKSLELDASAVQSNTKAEIGAVAAVALDSQGIVAVNHAGVGSAARKGEFHHITKPNQRDAFKSKFHFVPPNFYKMTDRNCKHEVLTKGNAIYIIALYYKICNICKFCGFKK